MKKKMLKRTLIKKFFEGTLEVGDWSKDFLLEPDYTLVYTGRAPYRRSPYHMVVAWRDHKGIFHGNWILKSDHPASEGIKDKIPKGMKFDYHPERLLAQMCSVLFGITCASNQEETDMYVDMFNTFYSVYRGGTRLWEKVDVHEDTYKALWNGEFKFNHHGLHDNILRGFMERRLIG